jgi:hypothetical protein
MKKIKFLNYLAIAILIVFIARELLYWQYFKPICSEQLVNRYEHIELADTTGITPEMSILTFPSGKVVEVTPWTWPLLGDKKTLHERFVEVEQSERFGEMARGIILRDNYTGIKVIGLMIAIPYRNSDDSDICVTTLTLSHI